MKGEAMSEAEENVSVFVERWRRRSNRICSMNFQQSQFQFRSYCTELRRAISTAEPGHEFDAVTQRAFELDLLAERLGFAGTPVNFASGKTTVGRVEMIQFSPPFDGPHIDLVLAIWPRGWEAKDSVSFPLETDDLRRIDKVLESWAVAADGLLETDFQPDYSPSQKDIYWLVLESLNEHLRTISNRRFIPAEEIESRVAAKNDAATEGGAWDANAEEMNRLSPAQPCNSLGMPPDDSQRQKKVGRLREKILQQKLRLRTGKVDGQGTATFVHKDDWNTLLPVLKDWLAGKAAAAETDFDQRIALAKSARL